CPSGRPPGGACRNACDHSPGKGGPRTRLGLMTWKTPSRLLAGRLYLCYSLPCPWPVLPAWAFFFVPPTVIRIPDHAQEGHRSVSTLVPISPPHSSTRTATLRGLWRALYA